MASLECLQEAVRVLVAERQALHDSAASRNELESNRLELARRHRQVSQALIDRYLRNPSLETSSACFNRRFGT